eukprot:COSAG06_NODE_54560_length_294_cov_0.543590_2_plen_26_part_01
MFDAISLFVDIRVSFATLMGAGATVL